MQEYYKEKNKLSLSRGNHYSILSGVQRKTFNVQSDARVTCINSYAFISLNFVLPKISTYSRTYVRTFARTVPKYLYEAVKS